VRRVVSMVTGTALAVALAAAIAGAATLPAQHGRTDIGSQLMLRLFGETSDATASFAAAQGDRASESPLRDLALRIPSASPKPSFASQIAFTADDRPVRAAPALTGAPASLTQSLDAGLVPDVRFSLSDRIGSNVVALSPSSALLTAAYQPAAPVPNISPAPGTLAFETPDTHAVFTASTLQGGTVRFEGTTTDTSQLGLHDSSYGAGANFNLPAGKRDLNLTLSSGYEHVGRGDSTNFSTAPLPSASSWQLPSGDVPLVIPNYAQLNRFSVGAGLAVPVVRGLTLNLNYDAQHLYGGYGLPGLVNLDTTNNSYGGKLTFEIPRASGTLSISAYQDRFSDSVLPINGTTQTREDVNFTVKF
jgi:hypothetical protein